MDNTPNEEESSNGTFYFVMITSLLVLLVVVSILWFLKPHKYLSEPLMWKQNGHQIPFPVGTSRNTMYNAIQKEFMTFEPVRVLLR
jgi:hypothetical protein